MKKTITKEIVEIEWFIDPSRTTGLKITTTDRILEKIGDGFKRGETVNDNKNIIWQKVGAIAESIFVLLHSDLKPRAIEEIHRLNSEAQASYIQNHLNAQCYDLVDYAKKFNSGKTILHFIAFKFND